MGKFLLRRLAYFLVLVVIATALTYVLAGGALNPRSNFEGRNPPPPPAVVDAQLDELNLNDKTPILRRFGRWTNGLMHGDLGLTVDGSSVKVERQTEAGYDEVVCPLPALVTVTAGVVEPRYPSFKGIMAAKSKPVDNLTVTDLGIDASLVGAAGAGQEITDVSEAEARGAGEIVVDEGDGAQRVVAFLEQLKVV